ncbi:MAG TPA: FAD-dependent oxidoreductase [Firmicutes bacterium]|nr:FAD-dependent oxidoreductase [Bacillota bacterium]
MADYRIKEHPVLDINSGNDIVFFWEGHQMKGREGEMVSAALFANGVRTFSYHSKDGAPLGLFCANGQCGQCTVLINGRPLKACMTPLRQNMRIEPLRGLPALPEEAAPGEFHEIEEVKTEVLIIGGGPAGLTAALELGKAGVKVLLIDDKEKLGGKLVLQTHKFFGSVEDSFAGTRGFEIGEILEKEVRKLSEVDIWLNTAAIAVYSDKKVGVLKDNNRYVLVQPKMILNATGAREKSLPFPGNTLPGVYGAGAFQTLVNRDLVKASDKLFIVGGGNVGLIAGYHALQAGIDVVGLIEAQKEVGGYKVHKDKLMRMGVPVYTRHTVVSANGKERVESVTIAEVDERFRVLPGSEKTFACDTLLIAVGLDPVNEFHFQACDFGMESFLAGDAEEIAEASAAMFSGKIKGLELAGKLKEKKKEIPEEWTRKMGILKSRPGKDIKSEKDRPNEGVYPIFNCGQEIPCNPCTSVCPRQAIYIDPDNMMDVPVFIEEKGCIGCMQCVAICPGLAVTLVDFRKESRHPLVTLPYEFGDKKLAVGDNAVVTDKEGHPLGEYEVVSLKKAGKVSATYLVQFQMPAEAAKKAAGLLVQADREITDPLKEYIPEIRDDEIVCRCERVTAGEIRELIRKGIRDINQLKAVSRAGMGACGGKTCQSIILRLMREEGVDMKDVTKDTLRPLFFDTPLGYFAGIKEDGTNESL